MTDARSPGVVVDTMVISWLLDERPNPLADRYRDVIGPQPVPVASQTVMELRFGALRAGWAELRRRRLERRIADIAVVQPDDQMITACAELRLRCQQAGHALANKPRAVASSTRAPCRARRLPARAHRQRHWLLATREASILNASRRTIECARPSVAREWQPYPSICCSPALIVHARIGQWD